MLVRCKVYVVTKKDQKPNSQQSRDGDNSGRASVRGKSKHRSAKGEHDADEGYKQIRTGCYFCERPHKFDDCTHWAESVVVPAESPLNIAGLLAASEAVSSSDFLQALARAGTDRRRYRTLGREAAPGRGLGER